MKEDEDYVLWPKFVRIMGHGYKIQCLSAWLILFN